jgi:hypothetical protein
MQPLYDRYRFSFFYLMQLGFLSGRVAAMRSIVDGSAGGRQRAPRERRSKHRRGGSKPIMPDTRAVQFDVMLPAGSTRLETWLTVADGSSRGVYYVSVRRLNSVGVRDR